MKERGGHVILPVEDEIVLVACILWCASAQDIGLLTLIEHREVTCTRPYGRTIQ
jgi:hypothetical protein